MATYINNSSSSKGIGFAGLLAIVFVVLKLIGVIDWSWLWVLSPIWIPAIIVLIVILVFYLLFKNSK